MNLNNLLRENTVLLSITIVSSVIGVITFLYNLGKIVYEYLRLSKYNRTRNIGGVYVSVATNMRINNERFIHDVIIIEKTLFGRYVGKVILYSNPKRNHFIKFKVHNSKQNYFRGTWINTNAKFKKGFVELTLENYDEGIISGVWTGVTSENEVNGGAWYFRKVEDIFDRDKIMELSDASKIRKVDLSKMIQKHKLYKRKIKVHNLSFEIREYQFNPLEGKICIPLLEEILTSKYGIPEKMLDLGCGIGVYSIILAKRGCRECIGIDIDKHDIHVANKNARKHDVKDIVEFRLNQKSDLFAELKYSEKFDLIIANLPFSANVEVVEEHHEKYLKNFRTSAEMLINFVIGSQLHLKENGQIYFAYSDSGFSELLLELIKYTNYVLDEIEMFVDGEDIYYIYRLKFSDKFVKMLENVI